MAENDNKSSSELSHGCNHEQNTVPSHLLSALKSSWKAAETVIGMLTYGGAPADGIEAIRNGLLRDQSAGNRRANAPNNKISWGRSENTVQQPTLYEAFPFQDERYLFWEPFLAAQLLEALSAKDVNSKPINSVAEQDHNLPLASRPESTTQHLVPVPLYTYYHKIQETLDLTYDIHIDGYHSMSCLVDDLRSRKILHYLVPPELEGEFSHINRIQFALRNREDDVASTLALAGYWLHQCWSNHPECPRPNLSSKVWPKLPNRVIDLADYHAPPFFGESTVKVIETNASRGAYVALSYRWPKKINKSSMLSRSTMSKLSQGIAARELLSEIQDACILAKGLGIQYLWVDALCIIQGRGGDWHIQAPEMASIYKNAVVTIAAVDGTSLSVAAEEAPFLSNQQQLSSSHSPHEDSNQESTYLWLSKSGNFISRPLGELDNRGWVYQEQLLSSRIISLTKEGVFWDCLHHSASSNRPVGIQGDFSPDFVHSDTREFKRFLVNPNALVPSEEYYWLWRRAVQSYTKRKLTNKSDRFIAIEGIARQMALLLDDECILGVWKKDALRSLIWFVEPADKEQDTAAGVHGPSWSWISVNSPIQYRVWHPYERYIDRRGGNMTERAAILELSAKRENPLGFDRFSGQATVLGALTHGYLYKTTVYFARRLKDRRLLDELAKGPEDAFLTLKTAYAENATGRYYIEDVLLDFRLKVKDSSMQSSGSKAQENLETQHGRNERHYSENFPLDASLEGKDSSVQSSANRILENFETQGDRNKQLQGESSVQQIRCLLLLEGGYTDMLSAQYCLILQEDLHPNYRRIGLAALNIRHICLSSKLVCTGDHEGYSDCMGTIQRIHIR